MPGERKKEIMSAPWEIEKHIASAQITFSALSAEKQAYVGYEIEAMKMVLEMGVARTVQDLASGLDDRDAATEHLYAVRDQIKVALRYLAWF